MIDLNDMPAASEGSQLKNDLTSGGNCCPYLLMIELMGSAGASDGRLFKNDLMFVGIEMLKESFGTEPVGNGYPVIIDLNGIVAASEGSPCKYDLMLGGHW